MSAQIKAIHTLKTRLRLVDDDYRALLFQLTGQRSSKDCNAAQQRQVRDHLQNLAQRMGVAAPARKQDWQDSYKAASPRERKVWALWGSLGRAGIVRNTARQALDAFVYRQVGVASLRFCTPAQLDTVIESLKLWQRRGEEPVRK